MTSKQEAFPLPEDVGGLLRWWSGLLVYGLACWQTLDAFVWAIGPSPSNALLILGWLAITSAFVALWYVNWRG